MYIYSAHTVFGPFLTFPIASRSSIVPRGAYPFLDKSPPP